MLRRPTLLTFALCAALLAVPAAGATASSRATTAQASGLTTRVPLAEGGSIAVTFTPAVGLQAPIAQQYVAFLESLPHGPELSKLRLLVATPDEVDTKCGGTGDAQQKVLGCYLNNQMTVPSSGLDGAVTTDGTYDVRYVLTHEYGHHIAAHRANQLGAGGALAYGPKYWSSYEMVCNQALHDKLFPYAESDYEQYLRNPGEAWAETYARLVYPNQPWTWTDLLKPDATALDAARRDVLEPWTKNATKVFTMDGGRTTQTFALPLTLDGSLKATVRGPSGSEVSVNVTSGSQQVGKSKRTGAYDRWNLQVGCRETATETLSFKVTRAGGTPGPVTLRVSYAG